MQNAHQTAAQSAAGFTADASHASAAGGADVINSPDIASPRKVTRAAKHSRHQLCQRLD